MEVSNSNVGELVSLSQVPDTFAEKIRYQIEENKRNDLEYNEQMAAMADAEKKRELVQHKAVRL